MSGIFTIDMWNNFKQITGNDPKKWRGLTLETCSTYGVRHQYNESDGQVSFQYYPCTKNYDLCGIKWRSSDKKWSNKGDADSDCDLFGQIVFRSTNSKTIVIASGEVDTLSLYQALNEYNKSTNKGYDSIPVVCSITGEGGYKQYQKQYDWLNKFDRIIICPDQDEPGLKHLHKLAQVLPRNKLFLMELPVKDVNELLVKGKSKDIVSCYFKARSYTPAGIKGSDTALEAIKERTKLQKIDFPEYAHGLNEMLAGGIPLGYIVNILAGCYPSDTEFFNGYEWKPISEYKKDELVLTYNKETNEAFLEKPNEFIDLPTDQFYNISNKRVSFTTSSYHKHLVRTEDNVLKNITTLELLENHNKNSRGNRVSLLNSFNYSGTGINISDAYLRLKIAVFADGHFTKKGNNKVRINIKKERKKVRLRYLLSLNSIDYNEKITDNGYSVFTFLMDNRDKNFPIDWYNGTKHQFEIIKDEVIHWDGSIVNREKSNKKSLWVYTTLNKKDSDFIQFVLASLNLSTTVYEDYREKYKNESKTCYNVSINYSSGYGISKDLSKQSTTEIIPAIASKNMYCFTTSTGYFVVRQNNKIVVSGNSGSGKSSIINDFVRYRISKKDYLCGIVSLEADEAEYGENLLSSHVGQRIARMDELEKEAFLNSEELERQAKSLFINEETGEPTYYLIDDRGDFDAIESKIEELIIKCGCQVIIVDVLTDIFAGRDIGYQEKFLAFEKQLVKAYPIAIINIVHSRKSGSGQQSASTGGLLDEESMVGSGSQYRSGGINLILQRNKLAENDIDRNTLKIFVSKNRAASTTGLSCSLYYESNSARFYDLEDYKADHPEFFQPTESDY